MDSILLYFYIPCRAVRRVSIQEGSENMSYKMVQSTHMPYMVTTYVCPQETEAEYRIRCYALPASITVQGAIGMVCGLCKDEFSWGYYNGCTFRLKVLETGIVLDNDKTLKEQNIGSGTKLVLIFDDSVSA